MDKQTAICEYLKKYHTGKGGENNAAAGDHGIQHRSGQIPGTHQLKQVRKTADQCGGKTDQICFHKILPSFRNMGLKGSIKGLLRSMILRTYHTTVGVGNQDENPLKICGKTNIVC